MQSLYILTNKNGQEKKPQAPLLSLFSVLIRVPVLPLSSYRLFSRIALDRHLHMRRHFAVQLYRHMELTQRL